MGAVSARSVLWLRETPFAFWERRVSSSAENPFSGPVMKRAVLPGLMVRRLGALGSMSPKRMVPSVAKSSLNEVRISKLGKKSLPDCLRALTVRLWSRSIWFG